MSLIAQLHSSESNDEWYTPVRYLGMVRKVFNNVIDLDPCSSLEANKRVGANRIFTIKDDALMQPWQATTVFMNPPYGKIGTASQAGLLCKKLVKAYWDEQIEQAIILVNSCTGAKWFHPLFDWTICFVDHRIRCDPPEGSEKKSQPTKDNVFVYLGPRWDLFHEVFSDIGRIRMRSALLPQFLDYQKEREL